MLDWTAGWGLNKYEVWNKVDEIMEPIWAENRFQEAIVYFSVFFSK